ncbi:type I restriction enzyme HsdR N-terminal domain-containing protein [Vibrio sp. SCSIO 43132]|uniref:type I restriction enzyme HsdR N-terminal domain-containing protein n=1 Tax=Vibrio sp. SCSIO 43132 TaxID=2779363 RepID=UPI001CA9469A|nr:type I restriction enzyme HsdR N-terminal domain-containing protein [Vibrio sp. SCSIO 43132]UAB70122.1 type I restriction enzyme HsdR N-terminal domain-containing protein [Vibrio sp. SCSIO 43132]
MFDEFELDILNDPEYKEDAVREDIVAPLLRRLGYKVVGSHKMVRSRALTHPYVYIGTKAHKVSIIPDYLLEVDDNDHRWILDAKAPNQNILSGKNVEQAFSYAIHPDIRAHKYALCNGKEIAVFDVNKLSPVLHLNISDWENKWHDIEKELSPISFTKPHLLNFKPDFGLYMKKIGAPVGMPHSFIPIGLPMIMKVQDGLYTACVNIAWGDDYLATSFDFDTNKYHQLLSILPENLALKVAEALTRQPYSIALSMEETPLINVSAVIGEDVHSNENEEYSPLWVIEFSK